jgi:hypothetical protein
VQAIQLKSAIKKPRKSSAERTLSVSQAAAGGVQGESRGDSYDSLAHIFVDSEKPPLDQLQKLPDLGDGVSNTS